jgi:two-component system, cell cycle response regulator CpdR
VATILIAEDNELIRRVLTTALVDSGHRVVSVESSAAALSVEESFDVALVDVYLDRNARTDLPEELRRRDPQIRIVVMSGLPVEGHYPSADAVLQKPFSLDELRETLARTLSAR